MEDHPTHDVRISMSSYYDVVCNTCGMTGVRGHEGMLELPCGELERKIREDRVVNAGILLGKSQAEKLAWDALKGNTAASKWIEFANILALVTYKPGWYIRAGVEDTRMWYQVGVTEEAEISFDPIAGEKVPWRGAKHYLSEHMCRNEIVTGIKHAIDRAEMHEVNEWFRYKGKSIYNPHLDPDSLVEVAKYAKNFNTRKNAMTMEDS